MVSRTTKFLLFSVLLLSLFALQAHSVPTTAVAKNKTASSDESASASSESSSGSAEDDTDSKDTKECPGDWEKYAECEDEGVEWTCESPAPHDPSYKMDWYDPTEFVDGKCACCKVKDPSKLQKETTDAGDSAASDDDDDDSSAAASDSDEQEDGEKKGKKSEVTVTQTIEETHKKDDAEGKEKKDNKKE